MSLSPSASKSPSASPSPSPVYYEDKYTRDESIYTSKYGDLLLMEDSSYLLQENMDVISLDLMKNVYTDKYSSTYTNWLLMENEDYLLLEDGEKIKQEIQPLTYVTKYV